MRLYEFEGKEILRKYGIPVPNSYGVLAGLPDASVTSASYPCIAKIQVLEGARGKRGGVLRIDTVAALERAFEAMSAPFAERNPQGVLLEEAVPDGDDFYFSISYRDGKPCVCVNSAGGVEVEGSSEETLTHPVDILVWNAEAVARALEPVFGTPTEQLEQLLQQLLTCFLEEDCTLLEVNPLRRSRQGTYIALDCKMVVDDAAFFRHEDRTFAAREEGRKQSDRERAMEAVNQDSALGGTPCRYVELDGDVALLLSGGGASLAILDTLVDLGMHPGNYSEYSGNPKREKVAALTRVVLGKPDQRGLFIAGGVANFTLVDETLAGVEDVLREVRPTYPIVIRRGGPHEDVAKENIEKLVAETGMDITWLGSEQGLGEACAFFAKKMAASH